MNTKIQEQSIYSQLMNNGSESAKGRVRSQSLLEEMTLVGFVPYNEIGYWSRIAPSFNLNAKLLVTPYYLKVGDGPVYPYYDKAKKAKGVHYSLDENLIIDKLSEYVNNNQSYPFTADKLDNRSVLRLKQKTNFLELDENTNENNYVGQEDDIELYRDYWKDRSVSNDLLCLCVYMNKVTGKPSYILLPSTDVFRVIPEKEN